MPSVNEGFLAGAHKFFLYFGFVYAGIILASLHPWTQRQLVYMNILKFPFWSQYDKPEHYGLAPGKAFDLRLTTSDDVSIGAWFILPDEYYRKLPAASTPHELGSILSNVLQMHKTALFLHGNAATRAAPDRVSLYQGYSNRLNMSVLAIDYRGFGNSAGVPSEDGVVLDAHAAWDFLLSSGSAPSDVIIVGHSLGTGISAKFAAELAREGREGPRGVALMSPFSSVRTLLDTYSFFGLLPLMKPLSMIPGMPALVTRFLIPKFDTLSVIKSIPYPIVLGHAINDYDIPHTHSSTLFNALVSTIMPSLPPLPRTPNEWSKDDWSHYGKQKELYDAEYKLLVERTEVPNFGVVETAVAPSSGVEGEGTTRKVVLAKVEAGGHNHVMHYEGMQDVIRQVFEL